MAAFFFGVSPAHAAGVIDQTHAISGLVLGRGLNTTTQLAQTFTVDRAGLLTRVDLKLSKSGNPTDDVIVAIRRTYNTDPLAGAPGASPIDVLYQTTVSASAIATGSAQFTLPVDLQSAGILVSKGEVLAVEVRRNTTTANVFWGMGSPEYAGGANYSRSNAAQLWSGPSSDAGFQTWVDSAITSGSKTLSPAFDGYAELVSGSYIVHDGDTAMPVDRSQFSHTEHRGILEYPIFALPPNAVITSATLQLDTALLLTGITEFPSVSFHGYAGDGVLGSADATMPSNPIGQTGPLKDFDTLSVPLDAQYIQSLIGHSDYLGLLAEANVPDLGVQFYTTEYPIAAYRPKLSLSYSVPLANSGDYNGDGIIDAGDYTAWRDTLGQAVAPGNGADGNGNGTIDRPDYAFWQSRFGLITGGSGDYNGNGIVDAADYTIWRDTFGEQVAPGTGADGTGDGNVDQKDYAYWTSRFGTVVGGGTAAYAVRNDESQASEAAEPSSAWLITTSALAWLCS